MVILLEWISQEYMKSSINFNLPFNNNSQIIDKSNRLLPILADLIINLSNSNAGLLKKHQLTLLEFIYWSLLHLDASFQNKVSCFIFLNIKSI